VVIPQRRASGLTETVAKSSAGALEHVSVARVVNLTQTLETLKAAGLWIYGLDLAAGKSYLEIDYRGPVAIVVGAEGEGVAVGRDLLSIAATGPSVAFSQQAGRSCDAVHNFETCVTRVTRVREADRAGVGLSGFPTPRSPATS
jgi:hypothetical protein